MIFSFGKKKADTAGQVDFSRLPRHIAIILDGNGRWAKRRGLPRTAGHKVGAETSAPSLPTAGTSASTT